MHMSRPQCRRKKQLTSTSTSSSSSAPKPRPTTAPSPRPLNRDSAKAANAHEQTEEKGDREGGGGRGRAQLASLIRVRLEDRGCCRADASSRMGPDLLAAPGKSLHGCSEQNKKILLLELSISKQD